MSPREVSPKSPSAPPGDVGEGTEVVCNPQASIRSSANPYACLVQIYPANSGLGRRHLLTYPVVLGRDDGCAICLDEPSVSRTHARLMPRDDGYYIADLRSTNGTFVNDRSILVQKLADGDYLRVGNHIFRFLAGGNIETDYHEEIYRLKITDALTGAYNKRFFLEFVERELSRSRCHHRPLGLMLLDIDRFKVLNESHGHLAGDHVLRALASRISGEIRRHELFARCSGGGFAIVLPETTRDGGTHMAERLRKLASTEPFAYKAEQLRITISIGVSATDGSEALTSLEFIGRAEAKLNQAKHRGRDCVAG